MPAELLAGLGLAEAVAAHCSQVSGRTVAARVFERPPARADAWLILVDGIDQVLSTRQRSRVLSRLGDSVAENLPHHRIMITTRPLMLGELGKLSGAHITRFTLRRFERSDLHTFAERWVEHRRRTRAPETETEPITLDAFLSSVSSSRLSAIARVPLIATITALILEADQDSALPTSRVGLYERFIQHLLNSRRAEARERDVLVAEFARHGEHGRQAWEWLRENLRELLEGTSDIFLSSSGARVLASAVSWVSGHAPPGLFEQLPGWEASLRTVLTSSSLIVHRTNGLQFAHPSFAEYLAAGPRSRTFDRSTWLADARSPDSRNLALFTLARSSHSADPLVTMLLEGGGTDACIAGEIVADGIEVGTELRGRVIDVILEQLARDDRSAPEALTVLINLTTHSEVTERLAALVRDGQSSIWVRAFTADALTGATGGGVELLRVVLAATSDDEHDARRWVLERLAARGQATEADLAQLADLAPARGGGPTSAMAAQWYREVVMDTARDPGHRLRALLTLAEGGLADEFSPLGDIIVNPALTPESRLDATRAVLQLDIAEAVDILRRVCRQSAQPLEVRVPVLAAMASARDEDARETLAGLAAEGGTEFAARFPSLAAWSEETGVRSTEQEAGAMPRIWGAVPPRNLLFTGRDEILAEMHTRIGTPTALIGYGGLGKTQIAIEYAYRYRGSYDLIWWIPADQTMMMKSALADLAPHVGVPLASAVGIEAAIDGVLAALRDDGLGGRWLLVFDQANQPEDIRPYIVDSGHVIVTSRNPRWESQFPVIELDVFTREESIALLRRRLPDIDEASADQIAARHGDIATSLEASAALLAVTGQSVGAHVREFEDQVSAVAAAGELDFPAPFKASVDISVGRLADEDPTLDALLSFCAYFGPEPIPFDVLGLLEDASVDSVTGDPVDLLFALERLSGYGLVSVDPQRRTVQLTRVVQGLLREAMSQEKRDHTVQRVHSALLRVAPEDPEDPEGWPRYAELVGHVSPSFSEDSTDPNVRDLVLRMVRYLRVIGDNQSARELVRRVLGRWAGEFDPDDARLQEAKHLHAMLLRVTGDYQEAREVSQAALAGAPDHLSAIQNHATDLRVAGSFAAARALDEKTATEYESLGSPNDHDTLWAWYRLALDLELLGDHHRAADIYTRLRRALFATTASRRSRLALLAQTGTARTMRIAGNYTKALLVATDAKALAESFGKVSDLLKLRTRRDYAVALRIAGPQPAHDESPTDVLVVVVDQFRGIVHPGHPELLAVSLSLGNALRAAGRLDEARACTEEVHSRYVATLASNHPFTYCSTGNLALIRRLQGDAAGALELNRRAYTELVATLGPAHPHTLTCALNLAGDHAALGQREDAVELGRSTLRESRKRWGDAHPLTAAATSNLSIDLGAHEGPRHDHDIELSPLVDE
ncbi:FxSxx-COOH system tetratricopeptide repeat protein [Acrocarpospora macrocephala]|uniref:FxSxx-COOH system tetratricopeptide repeat protein n=1 Tax=Acrocarpospora macrocephala TaxID=150177 RepID=UPI0012D2BF93|nr:FxSxx-COOH system tetratricopeptide repeat protein [Acrocarpospora macrocephala]